MDRPHPTRRRLRLDTLDRSSLIVCGLVAGYIVLFSWLAILRHETFGSSAMDLGYTDQVVWNTIHGRFMRFSTLENARIDLPLEEFRRTDTLLAFHVELLLVPVSLLYLIAATPITLLILQVVIVACGAWPAFCLAREHLDSDFAGVVFAAAYLLAPAIQGAILSDFHTIALTSCFLLFAFHFAEKRRFGAYFCVITLTTFAREDAPLLVFAIGAWLFFFRRQRRVGLITAAMGMSWSLICMLVILPFFNGLRSSPFLHRLAIFGPTLEESIRRLLAQPTLLVDWLSKPEILSYLGGLLASAGFMSLLSPAVLGLSAPVVAMNVFSTWSWTYSEGDHYSASIVPFVIASAIYGVGWLARLLSKWLKLGRPRVVFGLSIWVLAISLVHHHQVGVSPLARTFYPPRIRDHHRLGAELARSIPPDASVSAQSNLYPHLAHREQAYFYPAVNEAEYVFLDVTSSPYPLTPRDLYLSAMGLMRSGDVGILAAQDGYLLLKRGLNSNLSGELPEAFYAFTAPYDGYRAPRTRTTFGGVLELVGYEYSILNLVQAHTPPATVTTCWRPLRPLGLDYVFSLFFTREDGAVVYHYAEDTSTTAWYPTSEWAPGQTVCLQTPVLEVGHLKDVLLAVTPPAKDPWQLRDRLQAEAVRPENAGLLEASTLVRLFTFP